MDTTTLFPTRVRMAIYAISVALAPGYAVATANVDLHWAWNAAFAVWTAFVGLVAANNVRDPATDPQ